MTNNSANITTTTMTNLSLTEIAIQTSANGNPHNLPNKYTSRIDGYKLWSTDELIPDLLSGLARVYGEEVAYHLYFDTLKLDTQVSTKGETLFNPTVVQKQLLAYCKLVVSQLPKSSKGEKQVYMPLPIKVGQKFIALSGYLNHNALTTPPNIAGWGLIEAAGERIIPAYTIGMVDEIVKSISQILECENKIQVVYGKLKNFAEEECKDYTQAAVFEAFLSYFAATMLQGTDTVCLVDSHVYDCIKEIFTSEIPDTLVSVDSNWNRFLEFKVQPKHVGWYINQFANDMNDMYAVDANKNAEKFLKVKSYKNKKGEQEVHITFEGIHKLVINNDGVFEPDMNRQLYNAAVVTHQAVHYTKKAIEEKDIVFKNSYAVLLDYFVRHAAIFSAWAPFTGRFFRTQLMTELTFTAVEDCGAYCHDRRAIEKSTTITQVSQDYVKSWVYKNPDGSWATPQYEESTSMPYNLTKIMMVGDEIHNTVEIKRHWKPAKVTYVAPWRVDEVAFVALNLARSKKHFIDGRKVALQAKHVPAAVRTKYIQTVCSKAYGFNFFTNGLTDLNVVTLNEGQLQQIEAAVYADFPDLVDCKYNSEELWNYLGEQLVFGLSSKLAKLVKRTIMYANVTGNLMEREDGFFKQYGQESSCDTGQAVKCIVSTMHNSAQGVADTFTDDMYLFNHLVPHSIKRNPTLRPFPRIWQEPNSVKVDVETYMGTPTAEGKVDSWYTYQYEPGIPKNKGEQILAIPFSPTGVANSTANSQDWPLFAEEDNSLITEVMVRYVTAAGKFKNVEVKVLYTTMEHALKGRGIVKTMFINVDASVVYNDLNPTLEKGAADAIFYRDTNKWLDTTMNLLPMVYMTAHKNKAPWPEGIAEIEKLESLLGNSDWSPALDLITVYTPLRDAFDAKFGKKALWVQHVEPEIEEQQSAIAIEYSMYFNDKGWKTITNPPAEMLACVPDEYTEVLCLVQGEESDIDNPNINIKVFATTANQVGWYKAQRSRVYMGTAACPLYMPVKAEMASVGVSVGQSPVMAGVVRNIAVHDSEFASKMLHKNFPAYDKYAAFIGMSRSSSIQPINGAKGFTTVVLNPRGWLSQEAKDLLLTPKVIEIYKATQSSGKFLLELSKLFNKVTFVIKTEKVKKENEGDNEEVGTMEYDSFSIYLPVIVAQSAAQGYKTTEDMSTNISDLFVKLIHGANWIQFNQQGQEYENTQITNLCNRIGGAIKALAKTKNIAKCGSFGLNGVMSKPTSMYGIPLNEVWVKESKNYGSVYATMLRTYGLKPSELDYHPVMYSRAPMTATAKIRVRVIGQDHPAYNCLSEFSFSFNPVACYYHCGDFDGDINYLYSAIIDGVECKLPYLTMQIVVDKIKATTGNDQLHPGGSYYGDGFEVPSFNSVVKKRKFTSESLTLNDRKIDMLNVTTKSKASLGQLLAGSTRMLREAVGIAHRLFITTDIYISAANDFAKLMNNEAFRAESAPWVDYVLVQILAEIYEVPLGGFGKWPYIVFYEYIIPLINGERVASPAVNLIETGLVAPDGLGDAPKTTFSGAMNAAGMNGSITVHKTASGKYAEGDVEAVADQISEAIEMLTLCQSWKTSIRYVQGAFEAWDMDESKKVHWFLCLATEISVLMSKGLFMPEVENSGAAVYAPETYHSDDEQQFTYWDAREQGFEGTQEEYVEFLNPSPKKEVTVEAKLQRQMLNAYVVGFEALGMNSDEAIATSTVFGPIEYYRKTVCAAMLSDTTYINTDYFTKVDGVEKVIMQVEETSVTTKVEAEIDPQATLDEEAAFNAFLESI